MRQARVRLDGYKSRSYREALSIRKMTRQEFGDMIRDKEIFPELMGVSEEEIATMFFFFILGHSISYVVINLC